jgi:hypothetical protein
MTQITADLTDEQRKAIDQIEKLLRLAGKNTNQNEAAAATAKAQDLLAKFNLDMSIIEQSSGATAGRREDTKFEGGLYHFQREVWEAVAQLNFCFYWNQYSWDPNKKSMSRRNRRLRASDSEYTRSLGMGGYTFQHRVVGRTVNVRATKNMADYLLTTIERMARERFPEPSQFFTRRAVSYREGLAEAVIGKVFDRRRHLLKQEEMTQRDAKRAADKMQREGVSTATTLTLSSLRKSEHDANVDFIYGEGTSARWAAEEAERAEAARIADEAHTAWAKANPEEAAKQEEERRKARRRGGGGRASYRDTKERDYGAYYEGQDAGKSISIDPQAESRKSAGLLR